MLGISLQRFSFFFFPFLPKADRKASPFFFFPYFSGKVWVMLDACMFFLFPFFFFPLWRILGLIRALAPFFFLFFFFFSFLVERIEGGPF